MSDRTTTIGKGESSAAEAELSLDAGDDWIELLNFLGDVAADLLEADDVETIEHILDETVAEIISIQYTGLYLYDEDSEALKLVWARGFSEKERRAAEESAMERHPGRVVREAEGLHVPDVENDPENRTQDSPRRGTVRSRLFHPVVTQGECVGAMGFAASEANAFDREHIAALGFYSHLVGAAYGRLRRERRLRETRTRFERLASIFYSLGPDPNENIETIVRQARHLLDASFSLYQRVAERSDEIEVVAEQGLPPSLSPEGNAVRGFLHGRTVQRPGEVAVAEHIEGDDWPEPCESPASYLGKAVEAGEAAVGSLCVVTEGDREFDEADRHILSTLAKAVSLEEERRDANRRVSRLNETLRAIREVSQLIVRERNRPRILKSTCELLVETEAYEFAFVASREAEGALRIDAAAPRDVEVEQLEAFVDDQRMRDELSELLGGAESYLSWPTDDESSGLSCEGCEEVRRFVGIVLDYTGLVYGVLILGSRYREPGPQERTLLQGVANDVAFVSHMLSRETDESQLADQALRDWLTDLPNRALFRSRLEQALARADRHDHSFALLLVDLDNLKEINDSLGHAAGDRLLVRVSERLLDVVREYDTVARIGGDEFTIILEGVSSESVLDTILDRIERQFDVPFQIYGEQFLTSASIGVLSYERLRAEYETERLEPNELLRAVDRAMYEAKSLPGTRRARPDASDLETRDRIRQTNELREAIRRGELIPHYQPIVSLETGEVRGVEALARWERESGDVRPASAFIDTVERMGRLWALSRAIYRRAFGDFAAWRAAVDRPLRLFLNLSPSGFDREEMMEVFSECDVPAGEVVFEITEQDLLRNPERISALLDRGFEVAVDDFGTGYSSFEYLKRFDVDYLKVDMGFVQGAVEDETDRAILETICNLGDKLGLHVIGEGVETEEQQANLEQLHCGWGQGYLFGRPAGAGAMRVLFGIDEDTS